MPGELTQRVEQQSRSDITGKFCDAAPKSILDRATLAKTTTGTRYRCASTNPRHVCHPGHGESSG